MLLGRPPAGKRGAARVSGLMGGGPGNGLVPVRKRVPEPIFASEPFPAGLLITPASVRVFACELTVSVAALAMMMGLAGARLSAPAVSVADPDTVSDPVPIDPAFPIWSAPAVKFRLPMVLAAESARVPAPLFVSDPVPPTTPETERVSAALLTSMMVLLRRETGAAMEWLP